jgi:arylformamidase
MSPKPQIIDPEIEWDFDLRAREPRHGEYKTRWHEASAATRSRLTCLVDVSCGRHTDMTFDIFPAGPAPSPCFIFLHGGFWRSSDKSENSFVANAFAEFGITTVIMNYRLAPAVTINEIITELRLSSIQLFEQSSFYGIDQDNIHIGGFSAGGLLAARVFGTDWNGFGISKPVIRRGMALSGIFDPEPLISTSHNRLLGLTSRQARALNVIGASDIISNLALVACGVAETPGFKNQTTRYADISRQMGHTTHELWIKDRHHYDVVLEFADANSQLAVATRQMIGGSL